MTEVVAALIWDGFRFLACQRPAHKARGLLWEFVGGKVEPGETKQQALIRECREELAVTVAVGDVFMEVCHNYPDLTVHLTLYIAAIANGTPRKLEHHDLRWITVDEIDDYAFCPADEEILVAIKERYSTLTPLQQYIAAQTDEKYRQFQSCLIPTVSPARILGVKTPFLRKVAEELTRSEKGLCFLQQLPHRYLEEDVLHSLILSRCRNYDSLISALEDYLPYIDNWAVCDQLRPGIPAERREDFLKRIQIWLSSVHPYTVRFAMEMLMMHYLGEWFSVDHLEWIRQGCSDDYYINMMAAWYYATALTCRYETVKGFLQNQTLPVWVHNKTIQKAVESRRITAEQKQELRVMKR